MEIKIVNTLESAELWPQYLNQVADQLEGNNIELVKRDYRGAAAYIKELHEQVEIMAELLRKYPLEGLVDEEKRLAVLERVKI